MHLQAPPAAAEATAHRPPSALDELIRGGDKQRHGARKAGQRDKREGHDQGVHHGHVLRLRRTLSILHRSY
jgi:hypothetical protein